MIIERVWRQLGPGLEPLSGPDGAPLIRTIKLIMMPLVIRPSLRPELGADLLCQRDAARLEALIRDDGLRLRATARWFTLLKKARRELGIVAGHPQDLYFQPCFELATEHGMPGEGAETHARAALITIREDSDGPTVTTLKLHLKDPDRYARAERELVEAWGRRCLAVSAGPVDRQPQGERVRSAAQAAATLATEVLNGCAGRTVPASASRAYAAMVDHGLGSLFGRAIWTGDAGFCGNGVDDQPQRLGQPERCGPPPHLGLSRHEVPLCPEVGRNASTAALPAPLDRTIFERLFTVLQAPSRRWLQQTVPELVHRETLRCCAPLGLHDETLRVVALLGARLAAGLDPVGSDRTTTPHQTAPHHTAPHHTAPHHTAHRTVAHQVVNRRWQREASVLHARRMTTVPDPEGGALAALAAELHTPWTAYMRRLWVRLHGRDVHGTPLADPEAAWDILDGVARSVMMDYRSRVRAALRALSTTTVDVSAARSA